MFAIRPARRFAHSISAWILIACLGIAAPASALTIAIPADVTGATDVAVSVSSVDPAGPVSLWDEAIPLGTVEPVDGIALFAGVTLAPGARTVWASIPGEAGVDTTTGAPVYSWGVPGPPTWGYPGTKDVVSPCTVKLWAGSSTATVTLSVNGRRVSTVACVPGQLLTFPRVKLTSHRPTITIEAVSRTGATATYSRTATRHEFPYATCIIIDKSQFRLYWVRNQQLVKKYPIAHGRNNWTPVGVWKILAKYKTYAKGIYGPRKMRMFRRVGTPGHYRYVFTAYGIHGTNQPWVIGTMASHGCIRMYNRDVLELWPQVPIGTMVITRR